MASFSDHTVYIFSDVLRLIEDKIRDQDRYSRSTAVETDDKAYLFGQWTSSFNPVVHGVLAPSWGNLNFESQTTYIAAAKAKLQNNYQLYHIGEVAVQVPRKDLYQIQGQHGGRNTPGYLVVSQNTRTSQLEALLYESSSSRSPSLGNYGGNCRIEELRGKNPFSQVSVKDSTAAVTDRGTRPDHYGNGSTHDRPGRTDYRPPPPTYEAPTTTTGHVARMGRVFETGGRDAETRYDQWYAISPGQERLKNMYEGVQDIASDGNVEMKRDNMTHDMTFIFKSRGIEWEIAFPKDFPAGFLKLKELTWLGDKRSVTITKRNIPAILAEIKNIVKKPGGSRWL